MKKKVLSVLLTLSMMLSLFPGVAVADTSTEVTYPVTGGNLYFDTATGTITDCDTSVTEAHIPASINGVAVNRIGTSAFYDCSNLGNVTIPSSVTTIGGDAFWGCDNLSSITISYGVNIIGYDAFNSCHSLTSVIIPGSVTTIGEGAFSNCSSLTNVELDYGVNTIMDYAFAECDNLTNITIPNSVNMVGYNVFEYCYSLTNITIPDSVTEIETDTFWGCDSLTDVYYGGSKSKWNDISIGSGNESLTSATIHYNSAGPGTDPDEDDTSFIMFLSSYDRETGKVYFNFGATPYLVTENTDLSFQDNLSSLLGKYVIVELGDLEAEGIEFLSIKPVESKLGTLESFTDDGVYLESITVDGVSYTVAADTFLPLSDMQGKKVLFHVYEDVVVGFEVLQYETGRLDSYSKTNNQITIQGKAYPTNYMTDWSFTENFSALEGIQIRYYTSSMIDEETSLPFVYSIEESNEMYYINAYVSEPDRSIRVGESFNVLCILYRNEEVVSDWEKPAFVISDDRVISISDYETTESGYLFTVKGLGEGQTGLIISDSETGASATVHITVGEAKKVLPRSYRMNNVPSFYPNVYGDDETQTNFYNIHGLYVNNYRPENPSKGSDGKWTVSFDVYNHSYMYGSVDVYDRDDNHIESYRIDRFNSVSSLYDTGEQLFYLVYDGVRGKAMSYTSGIHGKHTPITVSVPDGGYFTISNNFAESPGTYIYNVVDLIMVAVNGAIDISDEDLLDVKDQLMGKVTTSPDFQKIFMMNFKNIAMDISKEAIIFGWGDVADAVVTRAEDILKAAGIEWQSALENVTGIGEDFLTDAMGPAGAALKFAFLAGDIVDRVAQVTSIASSYNASYIRIHTPASLEEMTVNGVSVSPDKNAIDSEAVLQVFRVANDNAMVFIDGEIPVEQYELYNICFIKDDKEVQPNGMVTVRIPIPSHFNEDASTVYRQNDDGNWVMLESWIEGNYIVFETDHFSLYAVVDLDLEGKNNIVVDKTITNGRVTTTPARAASGDTVTIAAIPNYGYKLDGIPTATVTGDSLALTVTPVSGTQNQYSFTMVDSDVLVSASFTRTESGNTGGGGGSSTTYYDIDVNDPDNGTVSITPSSQRAASGTYVTITVKPDDGYVVDEVTVVRSSNDDDIDVKEVTKDAKYTFTMPGGDVDVTVTFIEEEEAKAKEEVKEEEKEKTNEEEEEGTVDEEPIWRFIDVQPTDWYYTAVYAVWQAGLMNGTSDLTFTPDATLTRGMVAQILYNAEGQPGAASSAGFMDVFAGDWYANAVNWAAGENIVSGYGNGYFGPNDPVTREQLASILYRYAKSEGMDTSAAASLGTYSDSVQVSSYALEAMSWAVGEGIMSGTTPTTLDPQGYATRAQAASMLARLFEL